mmetsp:Transcript_8564/g.12623  ORF Transcript_8564/g.12623 Transcript_8564/m.12623 type:complete len:151 (-) Transcript_8564:178-630(-)|eukprot:CAMPEP_0117427338 /NCGR_PEP_ID=MMETSP0758-20121206/7206_1 /TAXON_ID=63605 /ORGANISM="Percolomonas cosmopolitus, Strain AE-1 (ATCC 50343)" /LENGTH=150 /DNA_ID=CAMNT_0005212915 /DNA_START=8 /DNA_END=460 /DNA_ORIENTATION=+
MMIQRISRSLKVVENQLLRNKYGEIVKDHYKNPRNAGTIEGKTNIGTGLSGAPACGDVMQVQIQVDDQDVIEDVKFLTYGCPSAIASSSYATTLIKGKKLDEALEVTNKDISSHLALPPVKLHCSMLAEDAIKSAVFDFKKNKESQKEAL